MDDLSSRFLAAYDAVQQFLSTLCDAKSADVFASTLRRAAAVSPVVANYKDQLIEFYEARNVIEQYSRRDELVVTPCESVVERMEAIEQMLSSPPCLGTLFKKAVEVCEADTPIGAAVKNMAACSYSQLPVYQNSGLIGLLTTDTIARWLGECLARKAGVPDEASVGTVLGSAEFADNFDLLAPTHSVFDALERFARHQKSGKRCDAIIITEGASGTCRPVGIITMSDVPKLYEAIK
jgi:CBS domain-containing protein